MNLGYLIPIIYKVYIWTFFPIASIYLFCWLLKGFASKIFKSYYSLIYGSSIVLMGIFFCVYTPLILIFWQYAGINLSTDLFINLIFIGVTIYTYFEGLKTLGKKFTLAIYLTPFISSYILFLIFLSGENIYKISKHCETTNVANIKKCTYDNGYYLGEVKAFKRHGYGKYYFNSGSIYDGFWKNNKRHGTGKTITEGKESVDKWEKGKKNN